jgi:hypothetical protein
MKHQLAHLRGWVVVTDVCASDDVLVGHFLESPGIFDIYFADQLYEVLGRRSIVITLNAAIIDKPEGEST